MSPTSLAALFRANPPCTAPTGASAAVAISADIMGDVVIWYIVNQTDTTNISDLLRIV